jgi:hypothetical protein
MNSRNKIILCPGLKPSELHMSEDEHVVTVT